METMQDFMIVGYLVVAAIVFFVTLSYIRGNWYARLAQSVIMGVVWLVVLLIAIMLMVEDLSMDIYRKFRHGKDENKRGNA